MKNNKEIKVLGKQNFLGKEIPVIEGGFGEGEKVVLAKTIAEIHDMRIDKINALINDNIDEFDIGVDLLDLKVNLGTVYNLEEFGFSKMQVSKAKNIFILSEQGYMALVSLMRTDKARELRKKFRREYFAMRTIINNQTIDMEYINALVPNIIQNTLQGTMIMINKNNEIIDKKINDTLDYAKNIITQQEIKHEEQLKRTTDLIGFRTSNTSSLSRLLKSKLADIKGYDVKASDYHYMSAKERMFRKMNVFKWEDIPVNRYNDIHAMIDSIDCLEAIEEI